MEEVKKRGRKKKEVTEDVVVVEKKKRGRKKKWENDPIMLNYNCNFKDSIKFEHEESKIDNTNYSTNAVKFGNITIKVHDKEVTNKVLFSNKKDEECMIEVTSSDDEEQINTIPQKQKKIMFYNKDPEQKNLENIRCFHCHYNFEGSSYYLPYDHYPSLDRYKLYGCFCSPNCVKTYCSEHKIFSNKIHLVGQFYKKLFGQNFTIKPAPSFLTLKDYGGKLTIEEFRKSFYNNDRYLLDNINFKVIKIN